MVPDDKRAGALPEFDGVRFATSLEGRGVSSNDAEVEVIGADIRPAVPTTADERRAELRLLFEQHNRSLVRFVAIKLGSEHEAKDVVQEAYGRLLGIDDTKVVSHLRAYLYRTASNIAADRLRERARRPEHVDVDPDAVHFGFGESRVEQQIDAEQNLEIIRNVIAELRPKCRLAFLLFRIEGQSYSQVADQLGVSESMIRKYVLQAMRHCHTRLRELSTIFENE